MALALGKLTTGTPKFRGFGFVGMHVKPITAQEKFNFPRANAILARAQALLWVRDCLHPRKSTAKVSFALSHFIPRIFFPLVLYPTPPLHMFDLIRWFLLLKPRVT
jgi:hypothetical protein